MKSTEKKYGLRKKAAACLLALIMLLSLVPFSAFAENDMTIYFAVPSAWESNNYNHIYMNVNKSADNWHQYEMTDTGKKCAVRQNECKVYSISIDSSSVFNGSGLSFNELQFQCYAGTTWKAQYALGSGNAQNFDGKIFLDGVGARDYIVPTEMTVYFEMPTSWQSNGYKIKFNVCSYDSEGNSHWKLMDMESISDTHNGNAVVKMTFDRYIVFGYKQEYVKMQFLAYDEYDNYKGKYEWTSGSSADYDGQIFITNTSHELFVPDEVEVTAKTVYFDATYSSLPIKQYELKFSDNYYDGKQSEVNKCLIPNPDIGAVYYFVSGTSGTKSGTMERVGTSNVYKVDLPEGYTTSIVFSSTALTELAGNHQRGGSTKVLTIPASDDPCFFADANDFIVYDENFDDGYRGGYWGTYSETATRDAAAGRGTDIVDVDSGTFTKSESTYYINTTLYDYYSDYELSGYNLDTRASHINNNAYRRFYSFRIFDTALSNKYAAMNSSSVVPIYTGQFQPAIDGWSAWYSAEFLPLYGSDQYQKFMSVNNSTWDVNGNGNKLNDASHGIVDSSLNGGEVKVKGGAAVLPFFDSAFLSGANSYRAVIGETYNDVAFPFTRQTIDNVSYWHFDSADTTLTLKRDGSQYFLDTVTGDARSKYKNLNSTGTYNHEAVSPTYGFFPFNSGSAVNTGNTYNYGFGAKMELNFHLTENGMVKSTDGQDHPIIFRFSGDDDLWVFIDDRLVLDVGGDHAAVTGTINFAEKIATVSGVKSSWGDENPSATSSFSLTGKNTDQHTMVIYYMERGMWSSNFKVDFNFPDDNQFVVEESVDVEKVNKTLFPITYETLKSTAFNIGIKNLATHYGTVSTHPVENGQVIFQYEIMDFGSAASGKLEPVNGAQYKILTETTSGAGGGGSGEPTLTYSGPIAMKGGQFAVFDNEFRRGSYIAVDQSVDTYGDLFKTKWTMFDYDGAAVTVFNSGTSVTNGSVSSMVEVEGLKPSDGRIEKIFQDTSEAPNVNKYQTDGVAAAPADSFVFRSYKNPDGTSRDTSLKLLYENEVKVGSLTITKAQAVGSADLSGTYTFTVTFSNVGGHDLESGNVTTTVEITGAGSATISGIPAGTEYTVTETSATDGARLVSVDGVTSKTVASGTIEDGVTSSHVFANYMELITIQITKNWLVYPTGDYISGGGVPSPVVVTNAADMPAGAYSRFQVQRRLAGTEEWSNVEIITVNVDTADGTVGTDTTSKTYNSFNGDKAYEYRVVEIDDEDNVIPESGEFYTTFAKVQYLGSTTEDNSTDTFMNLTFNNLLLPPDPEIRVKKLWKDGDDTLTEGLPASIEIALQRRSYPNSDDPAEPVDPTAWETIKTFTLSSTEYSGKTLGRYPEYYADGSYEYRVVEKSPEGGIIEDGGSVAFGDNTYTAAYTSESNWDENYSQHVITNTLVTDGSLTVTKTVTGSLGNKAYAYEFTLKLTGYKFDSVPTGLTAVDTEGTDGIYSFTLTHGDSITVLLPIGTAYEITETAVPGYTVRINNDVSSDRKFTGTVANKTPITVAYTNTLEATPPTGVDVRFDAAMLLVPMLGLAAFALLRRKKED